MAVRLVASLQQYPAWCKFDKDLEKEVCDLVRVEKIDGALALLQAYCEAMKCMEKDLELVPHVVEFREEECKVS